MWTVIVIIAAAGILVDVYLVRSRRKQMKIEKTLDAAFVENRHLSEKNLALLQKLDDKLKEKNS